jgi:hypothetical protein
MKPTKKIAISFRILLAKSEEGKLINTRESKRGKLLVK